MFERVGTGAPSLTAMSCTSRVYTRLRAGAHVASVWLAPNPGEGVFGDRATRQLWHVGARLPACLLRLWLILGVEDPFPLGRKSAAPFTVRKLSLMLEEKGARA